MTVPGEAAATASSARDARHARYARVVLQGIRVRRATSEADFAVVAQLRAAGFARVAGESGGAWIDETDHVPGVFSLIGYNASDQPLGTLRVQDGRHTNLELAKLVPLHAVLKHEDLPAAQFARLSVLKRPQATEVMFGLFKAAWRWCYRERLQSIVIATPPWSKPIYDFMHFEHLGLNGVFEHTFAGGAQHVTMRLPVLDAESVWRHGQNPLSTMFFDTEHPNLSI